MTENVTGNVEEKKSLNFIEQKVENDLAEGKNGGRIQTRFPAANATSASTIRTPQRKIPSTSKA